jgi:HAD superfamily hydrolase (TIGR01509 family)
VTAPALPAAVLWDMDGTIIDTEPYWMAEERLLVEEAGGSWTLEDGLDMVGNDLIRSAEIFLERTPVSGTPAQIVDRLQTGVVRRTRERLPWRPGVLQLLDELRHLGVPSALVTMSWTPLASVLLDALPAGTFASVVTGDQVSRGKPAPDPYLLAVDRLGVLPAHCVAIEDSPTGVASATAAGVPTIGVPHIVPIPEVLGAVLVPTLDGVGAADLLHLVGGLLPRT